MGARYVTVLLSCCLCNADEQPCLRAKFFWFVRLKVSGVATASCSVTMNNCSQQQQPCNMTVPSPLDVSASCAPSTTAPHYPAHFMKGSVIQLASGELKRVEDLTTGDFVHSANISSDLRIDTSVVENIAPVNERDTVMLTFCVGTQQVQVRTIQYWQ